MNAQLKPFAEPAEVAPSKTVVLAIEDEAAREAIAAELSAGGFHVIQVEDGYELFDCLELFLRVAKPAAIVAECALSGRSGLELCSTLAKRPEAPALVLIAAFDDEDLWARAEASGADFVVDNPVDVVELFDVLDLSSDRTATTLH